MDKKIRIAITIISAVAGIIIFFVTVFPEVRERVATKVVEQVGLDMPQLNITQATIDDMFGPLSGCPAGYYVATGYSDVGGLENPQEQELIYFSPEHELRFTLRNSNPIANSPVVIKKIVFHAENLFPAPFSLVFISGECGAGETEKIYKVNEEEILAALNRGAPFEITASVDESNKEPFDVVVLSDQQPEDYFKLRIPLPTEGIVAFRAKIVAQWKEQQFELESKKYYIGNHQVADKYVRLGRDPLCDIICK